MSTGNFIGEILVKYTFLHMYWGGAILVNEMEFQEVLKPSEYGLNAVIRILYFNLSSFKESTENEDGLGLLVSQLLRN